MRPPAHRSWLWLELGPAVLGTLPGLPRAWTLLFLLPSLAWSHPGCPPGQGDSVSVMAGVGMGAGVCRQHS